MAQNAERPDVVLATLAAASADLHDVVCMPSIALDRIGAQLSQKLWRLREQTVDTHRQSFPLVHILDNLCSRAAEPHAMNI